MNNRLKFLNQVDYNTYFSQF